MSKKSLSKEESSRQYAAALEKLIADGSPWRVDDASPAAQRLIILDRIGTTQSLINDGAAWHPSLNDWIGHTANDLIERGLCKPPRGERAKKARHLFKVRIKFGIDKAVVIPDAKGTPAQRRALFKVVA